MANLFTPQTDTGKTPWLKNFADKLNVYAPRYGILTAEVTDAVNTAVDWAFRMDVSNKVTNYKGSIVQWKNFLRDGAPVGAVVTMPTAPVLGTAPTATAPGGFARMAALAKRIKAHPAYSRADGLDLGIEGPAADVLDMDSQKPQIVVKAGTGGHPKFGWTLGKMGGLNVYKDEGTGYRFYARDNHPDYEDTAPLPANAATWKYKFIYVVGDEEVGQFSDPVVVRVGQ